MPVGATKSHMALFLWFRPTQRYFPSVHTSKREWLRSGTLGICLVLHKPKLYTQAYTSERKEKSAHKHLPADLPICRYLHYILAITIINYMWLPKVQHIPAKSIQKADWSQSYISRHLPLRCSFSIVSYPFPAPVFLLAPLWEAPPLRWPNE